MEPTLSRKERKAKVASDATPRTTLSFYRYVRIGEPAAFRDAFFARLQELGCLGRIYIASEGINAQMNVPTENFDAFRDYIDSLGELGDVPFKIAVEEGEAPSFYKLTIKVKERIVADGVANGVFDVTAPGDYLTAKEFNDYVHDPEAIVVDMRNAYESEVGHFKGAVLPQVETFREELAITPELLKGKEDAKIALYCTGGIRCEKASAWLKHKGFKDVKHLKGGIIDYKRQVDEEGLENTFRGKNFVFDERLGERISDEVIATCHLCAKEKADVHHHCKNQACHILFIGCDDCTKKRKGYCSRVCEFKDALPQPVKKFLNKNIHTKRPAQFKKNRMRPTTATN
ncbi:hypothetical protein A3C89_04135 [Candidatus Kaiserbacteria bacterium RIFCSPHIGHO2_02_FULL_50_50]|uniref:tRNA uridine(34) hydroxylase n=1 Tax=Candidatus Kaiserbacteria bacterium RIFCSPHIGHO2_02_FULL_50_50 TaxID=1798492 RepID=A0A1F6DCS8_9BACT|nr:MAG: hypothetical protein A3C89_04135 [Candidatus Kaiserbacteria bacterium RIFCSPHIGHO2_02_FULL_50_50]OGG88963.1 MAG: hypothetical protein A3G62_02370 [Candidatus Kaiserbacteria bacterium RIFCSPLOWO2_12_FULL_50_10]